MCLSKDLPRVGCLPRSGFVEVSGLSTLKTEFFFIDGAGAIASSGFLPWSSFNLNEPEHDAYKGTIIYESPQRFATTKVLAYKVKCAR